MDGGTASARHLPRRPKRPSTSSCYCRHRVSQDPEHQAPQVPLAPQRPSLERLESQDVRSQERSEEERLLRPSTAAPRASAPGKRLGRRGPPLTPARGPPSPFSSRPRPTGPARSLPLGRPQRPLRHTQSDIMVDTLSDAHTVLH